MKGVVSSKFENLLDLKIIRQRTPTRRTHGVGIIGRRIGPIRKIANGDIDNRATMIPSNSDDFPLRSRATSGTNIKLGP